MGKLIFGHGAELDAGCRQTNILCGKRCGIIFCRISKQLAACVFAHHTMPLVIGIYAADLAHPEKLRLCLGVFLHRMVEIKVILCEICKFPDGKLYACDSVKHK